MKVARTATTPTRAPDDPSERAPLVLAAPAGVAEPVEEDAADEADAVALEAALLLEVLFAAALTLDISVGIMAGLPLAAILPMSTVPSEFKTSGLAARKDWVYMMFCIMRG